ncbi:phospholipid/cholesterol/gamma-HCH transport system substrate-binding protein [Mariniflexile fucanivorans]|uniref:Phospholipid/cholesterol/gamma-HCH transport system substrate-binding protein n=1 Tax=Mariniflexile fucanivorans TaxID=264023 RepID=A0A4R1RMU6_9FLAO|nr:MlaD family protein [Mariniflexile fucanivorans]TCL67615.1 phospholipid/cholesterol/gamma-HCH transport system substrate-binding protein [Mariniflexile fucanivorans]
MKTNKNAYKVKLGIFVSIGILILFIIIFFIGSNQNLFSSKFKINTNFRNVSGLQVGGQVRFSGIAVGTIESVSIINDSTVNVVAMMDKDVKKFIKKDSKASITSEGVIGDKLLMISQGSSSAPEIKDGSFIQSMEPVEFDDILASIKITAENAEVITDELATMLIDINEGEGTLGKLLNDEGVARDMEKTMENLRQGSKGLEQNMEAAKHNFLLRGYFKKKEREKEKAKKEAEKKAEEAAEERAEKNK